MDSVKNRRSVSYPALSMCMKKKELHVWTYIFMWAVFQKQIALQTSHSLSC